MKIKIVNNPAGWKDLLGGRLAVLGGYSSTKMVDSSSVSLKFLVDGPRDSPYARPRLYFNLEWVERADFPSFPIVPFIILLVVYAIMVRDSSWWAQTVAYICLFFIAAAPLATLTGVFASIHEQKQIKADLALMTLKNEQSGHDSFFDLGFFHGIQTSPDKKDNSDLGWDSMKILQTGVNADELNAFLAGSAYYDGQFDEINRVPLSLNGEWYAFHRSVQNWYLRGRFAVYY